MLKHPIITRFSLLCLLGTVALGLGMGYALSALLTQAVSEWEWQNTAALVRREVEREGLQRIFGASADRAAQERWGRALSATITTLPEVVRVKVWSRDAEILWSDEPGLIGQRFSGNDELQSIVEGIRLTTHGRLVIRVEVDFVNRLARKALVAGHRVEIGEPPGARWRRPRSSAVQCTAQKERRRIDRRQEKAGRDKSEQRANDVEP